MELMALDPPEAKKDVYCRSKEVVVASIEEREREESNRERISKTKRRGILVARD